ncbi:MAG: NIPSNAP family protein [Aquamicrobium sp.]|nr:NIPSNAP family protein [Aquamicrobium sp.]
MRLSATEATRHTVHTAVVELRQYTLHPGARDRLIDLFDREFVETQDACGMSVLGQFRDLDRPDRFVWLRGFSDMESRAIALASFYEGPVWASHRDAANATMIDFDDVLLLRPCEAGALGSLDPRHRPQASASSASVFEALICPVQPGDLENFIAWYRDAFVPVLEVVGGEAVASLVTESSENTFPRLPVREGVSVFVTLMRMAGEDGFERLQDVPAGAAVLAELARRTTATRLRLAPTVGSLLR